MQQKSRLTSPSPLLTHEAFIAALQSVYDSLFQEIRAARGMPIEEFQSTMQETVFDAVATYQMLPAPVPTHSPTDHSRDEILTRLGRVEGIVLAQQKTLDLIISLLKNPTPQITPPQNPTLLERQEQRQNNVTPHANDVASTPAIGASIGQRHNVKTTSKSDISTPLSKRVQSYKKAHPKATIQEIAVHFSVSKSTIDRAIRKGRECF